MTADLNIGVGLEDSAGVLWFSLASAGGHTLKDGALSELQGLSHGRIHWFWEDPRGIIWIGHESGLFRHRDGRIPFCGGLPLKDQLRLIRQGQVCDFGFASAGAISEIDIPIPFGKATLGISHGEAL